MFREPLTSRPIVPPSILIPIDIAANSSLDVYIRTQSQTAIQLPSKVWHHDSYITGDHFRSSGLECSLVFLLQCQPTIY